MKIVEWYSRYIVGVGGEIVDTLRGVVLPTCINNKRVCTNMYNDAGKKVLEKVHRVVAKAYIPNPAGFTRVGHKDGNIANNHKDNLYWVPQLCVVSKKYRKHKAASTYRNIICRCYDKNARSYPRYGGRGVTVCKEWLDNSDTFFLWFDTYYVPGFEIDKDLSGGMEYGPTTCVFLPPCLNALFQERYTDINWELAERYMHEHRANLSDQAKSMFTKARDAAIVDTA